MKTINKLFLLLCLAIMSTGLTAQDLGIRVGINSTNANIDVADNEVDVDGDVNFLIGLFTNLPLGSDLITIQPELTYLNRGYSYDFDVANTEVEQSVAYIDLGALVRLNFGSDEGVGFYVGVGPQYSYALSGTVTTLGEERDIDFDADRLNRGEFQFAGAAGVTFGDNYRFFVEARYNGSLSNQSDQDNVDIKQNSIGLNGGVMIPLGY